MVALFFLLYTFFFLFYFEFLFFTTTSQLVSSNLLLNFCWPITSIKSTLLTAFSPSSASVNRKIDQTSISFSYRIDVFLRLLLPSAMFTSITKSYENILLNQFTYMVITPNFIDLFNLVLFSNPLFLNTKLFDISGFISNTGTNSFKVLYYIYKVPSFSTWLVFFTPYENLTARKSFGQQTKLISLEKLFKAAAWAEREVSELFGIFFVSKITNRKLVTDYFFKVYPLLKWVPSIGFTEVYCSAEGFFANRSVKVFNSSLS